MKQSATASAVPTAEQLALGELAINTTDGKLYLKKGDNSIVQVGGVASAGTLTGATLASNVLASSLTSVGTLTGLTVDGTLSLGNTALISSPSATALALKSTIPAGTGVTPTIQIICPSSAFTLLNQTATQPVFNTPQDTISLQASTTYMVEGQYLLQTGTTSHTTSISFVSSIAVTAPSIAYTTIASLHSSPNASTRTQETSFFTSILGGIVYQSGVLPNTIISFKGIIRTTDAGNLVPNLSFGNAPSATNYVLVGSYIMFYPIGSNTIDSVGTAIG